MELVAASLKHVESRVRGEPEPTRHAVALSDKVTAPSDCSGNVAHGPLFCIATTKVPLIITRQPQPLRMHIYRRSRKCVREAWH